jgi:tRNA pseudouridine38-40 synthase
MRTLRLTIAYDGTRYCGWQVQRRVGAEKPQPTVQAALEATLARILQEKVRLVGSGRTDAGVHAEAQVAHLKTAHRISAERLLRSVNGLLADDIAILSITEVPDSFHARFSAREKHYRYRLYTGKVVPPFVKPYVHHVTFPLNLTAMRREAAALKGRHNFRAFAHVAAGKSAVRTIRSVALSRRGNEIWFDFRGEGFLHTMVRSLVGTLLDVGRGRLPAGTVKRLLALPGRRSLGTTAPAKGLVLVAVCYSRRRSA